MRRFARFCCTVVLVGCGGAEDQPVTDTAAGDAATPAMSSLNKIAGKWIVRAMPETGDSTLVTYELVATADTSGWTITFPKRKPLPVRVKAVAGDSIVTDVGPYESVLRKDVRVITHSVSRLQDGKLVGTFVAGYSTTGPDSVLRGRLEGRRAP